jgi:hypothetical protein
VSSEGRDKRSKKKKKGMISVSGEDIRTGGSVTYSGGGLRRMVLIRE